MIKYLLTVLFCAAGFVNINAQVSHDFNGKVTDESSNPIPGVVARLLNTNFSSVSDQGGDFKLISVPAGDYELVLSKNGFAVTQTSISLPSEQTVNFSLKPSARELDAVVVTGQKREEALQKVPVSISSLSSREVRDYRLWNTKQITGVIPTLFSSNPGDNRNVTSIRGIATTSYDQAVATYVDGVNQFGLDTYIGELLDVDRIEVIRGPQGTLYGRNAMGGVINVITKQPGNTTSGFAEVNGGNYNMYRVNAGVRTPVIADKLYAGVSAGYYTRDGYYTNEFTGSDFDRQHAFTGNYFVKYLPSKNWTVDLNVKHHNNRNDGPFALINGKEQALETPFFLSQDATTTMVDNTLNGSLAVHYKGDKLNFSYQGAYQSNYRYYQTPIDGDFAPIDGITIINNYGNDFNKVKAFTQEIRFSSPAASRSKINWIAGAYAFNLDNPVKQGVHFGEDADMVGSPDKNFALITTNKGKGSGYSLFGQAGYKITSKLQVIAGARFDKETRKLSVLGEYLPDGMDQPIVVQPDTSGKVSFDAFSPKLGLLYSASDKVSVFANYSRGFRAGGLSQLGSDPSQPPLYAYDPEFSSNYEAGVKTTLANKRIHFNATVFYIKVSDAQVPTL
ncbi:MAG TPA: TonB-dependent receptor, partial [Flavitalea sp.]|nr:TonB-dependent receptor [Flavitalea sp.]